MPLLAAQALMLVPAYLLGGIPFSLIVGKAFFHVDLRTRGSGNLGATNTMRELGVPAGVAVLLLDAAKGAAAVALAAWAVPRLSGQAHPDLDAYLLLATFVVMAGHVYSPYLGFKGGKGVAAAAGALFYLMPMVTGLLLIVFIAVVAIWRMVSLGSIVVAAIFPMLVFVFYSSDLVVVGLATLAAVLVIWRHRGNISRIMAGTESRIGRDGKG